MTGDLSASPDQLTALALSLSELELFRARQLAWQLPATASLEAHSEIGLAIGACGRRMKMLLEVLGERATDGVAPSPYEEWQWLEPSERHQPSVDSVTTYEPLYESMLNCMESLGITAYEYQVALRTCCCLQASSSVRFSPPVVGSPQMILEELLNLGDTRAQRVAQRPAQTRRGNTEKNYDPRWQLLPVGSGLPQMNRIEIKRGLLHKLHHTAFREPVATEVPALNLFEYDGMPWKFYLDMAQQCEDEARHTLAAAARLEALSGRLGQYPNGYLGNYYHMFWEMTLPERLVAMNLDTEAEGQGNLVDIANRLHSIGDHESATLFEFLRSDERRHAQFGARWFRYLYPDNTIRKEALDAARALTVINLASAHAQAVHSSVIGAIDHWLAAGALITFEEPATDNHEREISLLAARR